MRSQEKTRIKQNDIIDDRRRNAVKRSSEKIKSSIFRWFEKQYYGKVYWKRFGTYANKCDIYQIKLAWRFNSTISYAKRENKSISQFIRTLTYNFRFKSSTTIFSLSYL